MMLDDDDADDDDDVEKWDKGKNLLSLNLKIWTFPTKSLIFPSIIYLRIE